MAAATEYTTVAQELYLSYFGRPADRAGLVNLTAALAAANAPTDAVGFDAAYKTNDTVRALVNNFGNSAESAALYTGTTSQFVTAIYQNLFNRAPDLGGLDFWTNAIDSGAVTKGQAAHSILAGAIALEGADAALVTAKLAVAENFTNAIDTAAEVNAYNGSAAAQAARVLLTGVTAATDPVAYQAAVNAALAAIVAGPAPTALNLTVGQDNLLGTAGNDTFQARVVQNVNGEQTNQLASGDIINGGAGVDTLIAKVQMASALNNAPTAPIQPETVDVEHALFTAVSVYNTGSPATTFKETVTINAKEMLGLDRVGSVQSDASLVIQNLTTLTDSGVYAERRNTEAVTIRMDHSGNDAAVDFESDLTVLFDNDYLVAGTTSSSQATYFLLDEKAELAAIRGETGLAAQRLANINVSGIRFSITDPSGKVTTLELSDTASWKTNATLGTINTHAKFVAALQDELQVLINGGFVPAGTTLTVDTSITDTTGLKDGTISNPIPAIVLKLGANATGYKITPTGFFQVEEATGSYDVYGVFDATFAAANLPVTSTIQLEKVGRGAEGGDLTVGAMSTNNANVWNYSASAKKEGIEKFNISVSGDATQFSDLASLQSTNNTLTSVNIAWAAGSAADLIIGNHNTVGAVANGAAAEGTLYADDDLTSTKNNALKDVREFISSNTTTNVSVYAKITDESVSKYLNLLDNGVNPVNDNANFTYTFGAGNDLLNINLSKSNLALSGSTNREDFTFTATTNAGNDTIQTQIGDGTGVATDDWYINSKQNANLTISAGAGNDTVQTYGAGSWKVDLGDGNDVIYSDNSGNQKNVANDRGAVTGSTDTNGVNYNHGRAAWVLNTKDQASAAVVDSEERNIDDLETDANNNNPFLGATLTVNLRGITAKINVTAANTTDLQLNNLIKQAIANDIYLSKLIVAEDGPASTLVIRSLVDGVHAATDFSVSLAANALSLSAAQLSAFNLANKTTFTTTDQVQAAVNAAVTAWNAATDYDSALANDGVSNLTGVNSTAASSSTIVDGSGNDVIVLSTSGLDIETVNLTNDHQIDVIYNVTNATINGLRAADYTAVAATNVGDIISLANGTTLSTWAQILGAGAVLQADGSYSLRVNNGTVTPPVGGTTVTLAAGSSAPVVAAIAAETFAFNVAAAKASAPNTQIEISGFSTALDKLQIDTVTALGNVKLAALNGVDGITVQSNLITNNTLVSFGPDANGDVITITLAGVTDASLVNVNVI